VGEVLGPIGAITKIENIAFAFFSVAFDKKKVDKDSRKAASEKLILRPIVPAKKTDFLRSFWFKFMLRG
jgi:hypothetical protein